MVFFFLFGCFFLVGTVDVFLVVVVTFFVVLVGVILDDSDKEGADEEDDVWLEVRWLIWLMDSS